MKKGILLFVLSVICSMAFAQFQTGTQWNKVLSDRPETFQTQLISSSENSIKVNVQVPGFYTTSVTTPKGEANVITVPKSLSTAQAGEPDMPMTGIPLMIGDKARMKARVIEAQYMDFEGIEVAPSKGDFPRTIDPETVPYTYGKCYQTNAFFPDSNLDLYEPYIIRDFRGQNMAVYPFAYNPATKTLRVYYNMTVEMYKVDNQGENVIESRRSNEVKISADFKSVYQRHFLNYEEGMTKYSVLDEEGDLLIICYDNFISNMTDFVNWKKTRGINTTIVGTSTAGSSYSAIQTYIKNQYNANNNISHVLLVGDVAQIPGYSYSGGGSSYSGLGDNAYGQISGSDIYNDVIIGRFSASTAARVTTQCNRAITYERDLTIAATWLKVAEGISRKEGGSGHNNEDDYQHVDNIRTDLLNYGYSPVYQRYANLSGYDGSSATISSDINSGVGIINYANHGQETAWGANSSGYIYYANSHVNALTNENKLPFIFSVACLVGKYDHSSDCFAEAWMNATNNSNPTGAIGTLMSYISQPWIPPMWAQDECVDILTGNSSSTNDKHSFGGVCINGLFSIFDNYSTSTAQAVGTYQAWIVYGDPTLMVRTTTPTAMTVTHDGTIAPSASSYAVTVSNGNGAVATITDANHNILGKATVSNGSATINISGTLTVGTELTLCVFGYNKVTYLGTISVVGGTQYDITTKVTPTNGGTVSGAGSYYENTQCTLTATPNTGYTFTNWKKGNSVVSTNASYTFTVSSTTAGEYTATFTAIPQYTITASANPTNGGTVSGGGTFYENTSCTLTATANTGYAFSKWTKNGTQVSTNPTYTFTVTAAGSYVANFDQLVAHSVTCNDAEGGTISASVSSAYMGNEVTLTATANDGYFFSVWTVKDANNNTIAVNNNQFTMPNSDVTVSATFVQGCNVTIADVEHGTVTASATFAVPGTTITLTGTPATDYVLSRWMVFKTGDIREGVAVTGNSFVLPAYDVTVVGIFKMTKEAEVAIGSGTSADSYLPTYAYYKYSLTQQIYTASEVGQAGTITKIAFKVSNSKTTTRSLDVYLKHTSKTAFTSNTGWETMSSSDKVFSGSVAFQSSGWTTITLSTPFEYDGTSNLVVCVDDNTGSYVSSSSNSPQFYVYSTNANRALRIYSDGTNYTATSPSSYSGTYVTSNNQITFTMTTSGSDAMLTVAPNTLNGFTYIEGEGPSTTQSFAVIGVDLAENITVTAPEPFEISDEEAGNYGATLTLAPESKDNREATAYDFEGDAQGWTFLKGTTGNSQNNWMHVTDYTPRDYTSGYGNNQTDGWMLSESYISGSTSGTGTAVTPDNYLVSPEVTLGGTITFWVTNGNSDYGAEHFALLVSTTNNTNINSFTQVQEWTLSSKGEGARGTRSFSDHTWYEYTVDLSAYSGMGYVAFRHFNCNDQWILGLDDVTIESNDTPVDPTDPTIDLLTANVFVRMKAGLSHGTYTNETLTVTTGDITSNVSLNGEVEEGDVPYYTVGVTANPSEGGTVTGAGNYAEGTSVTLTATASEGYTFTNWTKDGTQVSTETTYQITVTEAANYAANFTQNTYTITALVNPENAGTITGAGIYHHGDGVILTATANEGFTFVNWTEDGTVVCVNSTCTSTATGNRTLVANFEEDIPTVEQTITLSKGWNWWSTNVNIDIDQLKDALVGKASSITSQYDGFVNYVASLGWTGSLNTLSPAKMYKIKAKSDAELSLTGNATDPTLTTITLNPDFSWIGFPLQQPMEVSEALAAAQPVNGDQITSFTDGYAQYYNGSWYGSLQTLNPGLGYVYQSLASDTKTFSYPAVSKRVTKPNLTSHNNRWQPAIGAYPNVTNITLTVQIDGSMLSSDQSEVAAFVDGECRGSAKLFYVEDFDQYIAFLTVYTQDQETCSFMVYNDGQAFNANEQVVLAPNGKVGRVEQPFVLHAGNGDLSLFPNPAERGEQVQIALPASFDAENATVEVFNALGARVNIQALSKGSLDLQGMTAAGLYTVKLTDQKGNVLYGKLVVR